MGREDCGQSGRVRSRAGDEKRGCARFCLLDMTIGYGDRASLEPVTLLLSSNGDLGEAGNVGASAVRWEMKSQTRVSQNQCGRETYTSDGTVSRREGGEEEDQS